MAAVAYVDSSALLKLAVLDPETAALEARLLEYEGLVTSRLAVLECGRAGRRASHRRVLQAVREVLDAIYLLDITQPILDRAAAADPPALRSLDAIHLATALSMDEATLELITYDDRLAAAARARGLTVLQPGRARR
jgi:hypothetical protein